MRIGEVLGRVTLSRSHSSLPAGRLLLTRPLGRGSLASDLTPAAEELVVFDTLGASPGVRIGISEGREAANPFAPNRVPLDAYCACLLDRVNL